MIEASERQSILSPDLFHLEARRNEFKRMEEIEKEYIIKVLRHTNCNKEKAAKILGIAKQTLYNKWDEYQLGMIFDD